MKFSQLRREYTTLSLRRKDLLENPFDQFRFWFKEAEEKGVMEPNAMQLATTDGVKPSIRTVLLKGIEENAFLFFTNYQSRKALDIKRNPHAALLFYWPELERQVTIEGLAEKISHKDSENYFASRPRTSQIGAWSSHQGQKLPSREILEA
ncbi:MAG: pyridoxal 5'-phosphate synthase, partial [Parachlamydiaceae bacterium]